MIDYVCKDCGEYWDDDRCPYCVHCGSPWRKEVRSNNDSEEDHYD